MLLEKLVLCDIGTFRGEQTIELRPSTRAGKNRPVVLFGGLNGAGKTTLLNSIRHVLYGRQALEGSVTQKGYDEFLRGLIHNPVAQLVRPDRAHVELQFTYARLGKTIRYRVCRSWIARGASVDETLTISQNDERKPLLEGDGAQAFLSQLIPAGVSQFFFFDGEKISALAKDDSDEVLADAIRRLLGLDMADRLRSDLAVYLRGRRAQSATGEARKDLEQTYSEIEAAKDEISKAETELKEVLVPRLTAACQELDRRQTVLADRGGAWSVDRKGLEERLAELAGQRSDLQDQLKEDLSGISVFALAPKLCRTLLEQVRAERRHSDQQATLETLRREAKQLKSLLNRSLSQGESRSAAAACVEEWLASIDNRSEANVDVLHGLTSSDSDALEDSLRGQLPAAVGRTQTHADRLSAVVAEVTQLQDDLAHAPSDESIEEVFKEYRNATKLVAELQVSNRVHLETLRMRVSLLITLLRKVRKLEESAQNSGVDTRSEELAERTQDMIAEFKVAAAEAKCKTLERHFVAAFKRLARKEDIVDRAIIDPSTFAVTLVDRHGRSTPKKSLSAGEKQIFAIAMLEALAKTSGRNLPIIIDTPLGRLDSKHREKLVHCYFPFASHQVLVLSTDTEVDQAFYEGLRPSISHAFHLSFDEAEGFTTVSQGYFWKHAELAHAA